MAGEARVVRQAIADYVRTLQNTTVLPNVFPKPRRIIDVDKKPFVVVTWNERHFMREYSGFIGNPSGKGQPNWYTVAYVIDAVETGNYDIDIATDMVDDFVDLFVDGFLIKENRTLGNKVRAAGQNMSAIGDVHGGYIDYYGVPSLGTFINLDVLEFNRRNVS